MHFLWMQKSRQCTFYDNTESLSVTFYWYHSNSTKRHPWIMYCSHCPNNGTSGCLHTTANLTFRLQASCHTTEGNWKSKVMMDGKIFIALILFDILWEEFPPSPIKCFENNKSIVTVFKHIYSNIYIQTIGLLLSNKFCILRDFYTSIPVWAPKFCYPKCKCTFLYTDSFSGKLLFFNLTLKKVYFK